MNNSGHAQLLWTTSNGGAAPALSTSDVSPTLDLQQWRNVILLVTAGVPTGSAPTLDVQLDIRDDLGNWYPQVAKIAQLTGAGSKFVCAGADVNANPIIFPRYARIAWTVGGTGSPSFPGVAISLYGR